MFLRIRPLLFIDIAIQTTQVINGFLVSRIRNCSCDTTRAVIIKPNAKPICSCIVLQLGLLVLSLYLAHSSPSPVILYYTRCIRLVLYWFILFILFIFYPFLFILIELILQYPAFTVYI